MDLHLLCIGVCKAINATKCFTMFVTFTNSQTNVHMVARPYNLNYKLRFCSHNHSQIHLLTKGMCLRVNTEFSSLPTGWETDSTGCRLNPWSTLPLNMNHEKWLLPPTRRSWFHVYRIFIWFGLVLTSMITQKLPGGLKWKSVGQRMESFNFEVDPVYNL